MSATLTAPALLRTEGWPCPECDGQGGRSYCPKGCHLPAPYCTHTERQAACWACDGEATERCGYCGTERAEVEAGDTRYCMDCYEGEV